MRSSVRKLSLFVLAWFGLLATVELPAAQQTVHVVGPGGFADIGQAIAAANPGDVVEVATGTYPGFQLGKGLTITAQPNALVQIIAPFFTSNYTQIAIPPGQSARLRGLHFNSISFLQLMPCWVTQGTVLFESCRWTAELGLQEALRVTNGRVWLRDCELDAGTQSNTNPGLRATTSAIAAVDCIFKGAHLFDGANGAGHGIWAIDSSLHLVRCVAQGGDAIGFSCFWPGGDGVRTNRGEWLRVSDSALFGGSNVCGTPGSGLHNTSALPARRARNNILAGTGTVTVQPIAGPTQVVPLIGLAAASSPLQLGMSYAISYQTEPNATLFLFASLDLQPQPVTGIAGLPWALPGQVEFIGALSADAVGVASFQAFVPNLMPVRHVGLWAHTIDLQNAPYRLGPPVGGIVH